MTILSDIGWSHIIHGNCFVIQYSQYDCLFQDLMSISIKIMEYTPNISQYSGAHCIGVVYALYFTNSLHEYLLNIHN